MFASCRNTQCTNRSGESFSFLCRFLRIRGAAFLSYEQKRHSHQCRQQVLLKQQISDKSDNKLKETSIARALVSRILVRVFFKETQGFIEQEGVIVPVFGMWV